MSEVDDMKNAIAAIRQQREDADKRIIQAIDRAEQIRKAKRDESTRRD